MYQKTIILLHLIVRYAQQGLKVEAGSWNAVPVKRLHIKLVLGKRSTGHIPLGALDALLRMKWLKRKQFRKKKKIHLMKITESIEGTVYSQGDQ